MVKHSGPDLFQEVAWKITAFQGATLVNIQLPNQRSGQPPSIV